MYLSPINLKALCSVWCVLMLCATRQEATPKSEERVRANIEERVSEMSGSTNSGDRLEADMAKRLLLEMDQSGNRPDPHRPVSPELNAVDSTVIENLKAEDLARMSLDDPVLKAAYSEVFMRSMGAFEQLDPPQQLALADMRRRGESVSPMLLKLISENYDNIIEFSILGKIGYLETVRIEPFLEYAREVIQKRLRSDAVAVASGLLARHGTKEDIKLFEWALTQRPFAVSDLTDDLKILRHRLDSPAAVAHPSATGSATTGTRWLIGGLILLVLLGFYRVLSKGRRRGIKHA